jgi:hypothetical protein
MFTSRTCSVSPAQQHNGETLLDSAPNEQKPHQVYLQAGPGPRHVSAPERSSWHTVVVRTKGYHR